MTSLELIHQHLDQKLWTLAETFTIPDQFLHSFPDLVGLILQSKSMDTHEEKQSWFTLFPMMNDEQISKLRDILTREQQKLQEIDQKYTQKTDSIYTKTISSLDTTAQQQKLREMKAHEASIQEKDAMDAENLLHQI